MKKIIDRLINDAIQGIDVYHYNNSVWLIFTDRVEWVVELKKDEEVLWYNYFFFKRLFNYVSLDVVDEPHYITMWVEDMLEGKVNDTFEISGDISFMVEIVIKDGIKSNS